jgi:hypothetical protein
MLGWVRKLCVSPKHAFFFLRHVPSWARTVKPVKWL